MTIIYGVDTEKKFTPKDVRNAIVLCFFEAHEEFIEEASASKELSKKEQDEARQALVEAIVKKVFRETNVDWDEPTKEGIIKVCDNLGNYSKNFRNPDIIAKHFWEIMKLAQGL